MKKIQEIEFGLQKDQTNKTNLDDKDYHAFIFLNFKASYSILNYQAIYHVFILDMCQNQKQAWPFLYSVIQNPSLLMDLEGMLNGKVVNIFFL